jgi:Pentapeptide repeats (8 copies)
VSWAAIGVVVTIALAVGVVFALQRTGDAKADAKAVSDNAPLIAAVIALGGVLTAQMVSIALDQRRTQHEALQTYLAKMSELLLDKRLHEKKADYDPTRVTARLQTLAVLERLDAERKRTVLLFLREAQLINRYYRLDPTDRRVGKWRIALRKAPASKVLFYPHYVGLRGADLSGADLSGARLTSALGKDPVSLKGANLKDAKLSGTILYGADLSETDLRDADLRRADLHRADLSFADLRWANLSFADLRGANLFSTKVSAERLAQAKKHSGATMPDGQILMSDDNHDGPTFEDWLKSKSRAENDENSGS